MAKSKKWSEQLLIEKTLKTRDENGNKVEETKNILIVCVTGLQIFKKEFANGKWKGMNKLVVPFDFVVLAGDLCPDGRYYELEYFLGEGGVVYRALIQAVNPVTDIPLIVGTLRSQNVLPENFNPRKAWIRNDIDGVDISYCYIDDEGPLLTGGFKGAKDSDVSVAQYTKKYKHTCLYYYRGQHREYWIEDSKTKYPKIFVCGSDNVNDPAFAKQRKADIEEMKDHIEMAIEIADEYNLNYVMSVETENKKSQSLVSLSCTKEYFNSFLDAITEKCGDDIEASADADETETEEAPRTALETEKNSD